MACNWIRTCAGHRFQIPKLVEQDMWFKSNIPLPQFHRKTIWGFDHNSRRVTPQNVMPTCPTPQCITKYNDEMKNTFIATEEQNIVDDDAMEHHIYSWIRFYLCETSPVVTTEVVDMTFFPATSTASQTLSVHNKTHRQKEWYHKQEAGSMMQFLGLQKEQKEYQNTVMQYHSILDCHMTLVPLFLFWWLSLLV